MLNPKLRLLIDYLIKLAKTPKEREFLSGLKDAENEDDMPENPPDVT